MGDERRDSEYPDRIPTPSSRTSVWGWLFVAGLVALLWLNLDAGPKVNAIAYTDFKQAVKNDEIGQVTFQGQQLRGRYAEGEGAEDRQADRQFMTTLPPVDDPELLSLLEQHEVQIQAKSTEPAWWMPLLVGVLPWVLIFLLIFLGVRKMQERMVKSGQAGDMFGFGKSKAKRFRPAMTGVSFDDVAGLENATRDLREIMEYLKEPQRYTGLGAKIPKGILCRYRHSYLLDRIGVMLGGRVAEQLIMGEVSSGAEQDLKQVTQRARRMVSQWGMSETLGPVAFRRGDEYVFLGREMAQQRDFSEHIARLNDEEVQTLLCKVESQARELLEQHRPQLERLAERLLERETLDAHEIDALLRDKDSADADSSRRRRNTSVSEH